MNKVFRDDSPLTLVNSGEKTVWHPRRMDLPPPEPVDCASEGGTFREPSPARVPRNRPMFKTDEQMRAEGWEPATSREAAALYAVPLAILTVVFSVWAYWTWVA